MIDLNRTKEQVLAEIKASERAFADLNGPDDPRFVALDQACFTLHGKTPDELLPVLGAAFSMRFANLAPEHLFRDLIYLLKRGLGNAHKWGNQKDPAKRLFWKPILLLTHHSCMKICRFSWPVLCSWVLTGFSTDRKKSGSQRLMRFWNSAKKLCK
jgi:hypothetical protein